VWDWVLRLNERGPDSLVGGGAPLRSDHSLRPVPSTVQIAVSFCNASKPMN
jgi:hypothetical protein